jgi:hypothetical protein
VAYADSFRHGLLLGVVRDWLPLALALLSYREMGWFAQPHHRFRLENFFVRWDRMLLGDWRVHDAIESFGPVLPAILEIAYSLTYALAARARGPLPVSLPAGRAALLRAVPAVAVGTAARGFPASTSPQLTLSFGNLIGGCWAALASTPAFFPARMWPDPAARRSA